MVAHLASHIEGSARRDEDTKYDPDYCRERDGLQKYAEAGGGEDPLGQSSLNEEIPMRARDQHHHPKRNQRRAQRPCIRSDVRGGARAVRARGHGYAK